MKGFSLMILLTAISCCNVSGQGYYQDSLKEKITHTKEDTARYKLLSSIAYVNMFTDADSATKYGKLALQLAEKIKNKIWEGRSLGILCVATTNAGNYVAALSFGFKSLGIFEVLKDTLDLLYTHLQLMNCYKDQEDYKEALYYGYKGKRLFQSPIADSAGAGLILSVMSTVYEKENRLDSALLYGQQAYKLYPNWTGTLLTLGDIYAKKELPDTALAYYRTGIFYATNYFDDNVHLIDLYNNMSKLFASTGKMDSSLFYSYLSINQERIDAYPEGKLRAVMRLAGYYEKMNAPDSTIKYLKLGHDLKDSLFSRKKIREAQNFSFNERYNEQKIGFQKEEDLAKIKLYGLLGLLIVFLLTGFFLLRSNYQKQKSKTKVEKAYTELKSTQAQLIQSEKMASLGELTAGIAHEIQNPLNFVNNFSEINAELIAEMKDGIEKGNIEQVRAIANDIADNEQKINHHGKRADAIVKGMLQHSRASNGQKEPTNINALSDEYLRLAYHGLRAKDKSFNATLQTDFDESIGKINLIPQDIGRVILNLITNAFYAVAEKKKQMGDGYKPTVSISTKKIEGKVELSVRDNGNGIPQKVVDKIFQPFFTTKPTGQGTGLGLSMSYDIIKAHSGVISVESTEGEGTRFIVQLPIA